MRKILFSLSCSYQVESINPTTGEHLRTYHGRTNEEINDMLTTLDDNFKILREMDFNYRREYLSKVCERLEDRIGEYAELMALEMGKPISQGRAEIQKCVDLMKWYFDNSEEHLKDVPSDVVPNAYRVYEPLGVIMQLPPFNFPFWQVIRFITPTMLMGNTVLIRHTKSCPQTGEELEDLFDIDGYPCFLKHLVADREQVADIITDRRLKGTAFTGSTPTGKVIAAQNATWCKPHVLELGGSDPFIVFDDLSSSELDVAVDAGVASRFSNCGQVCIAAKRFFIHENIIDEFTDRFIEKVNSLKVGDPLDMDTFIGPMAREDLLMDLHQQVEIAKSQGAHILCGGKPMDNTSGFFYEPTVITNVTPEMSSIFVEETFGPVAPIVPFTSEEEVIELANSSMFGLGGAVFTKDLERGERIARKLEVGITYVNDLVRSHWALPFGGTKESGFGRECGEEGLFQFCNLKTLIVSEL